MWLHSRGDILIQHPGRLVLSCGLEYGVYPLVSKLTEETPRIWLEFNERDCYDDLAQGDKLAEACADTLGSRLYGLPYQYGMSVLKSSLATLEPHIFIVTNAHYAPEFAKDFLTLQRAGHKVIVHFGKPIASIVNNLPSDAKVLGEAELKLSIEEAYELTAKRLLPHEVEEMYESSQGAHDLFVLELCKRLLTPPPLISGPNGPRFLGDTFSELDAAQRLELLVRQERSLEALELAAHHLPERVPGVLVEAGHVFHERGLHKRLWGLLSALPVNVLNDETVLYWQLMAAFRLGQEKTMEARVKTFLDQHEAPELRTLYAGVLAPYDQALAEAKRAHEAKPSAYTLYQMGLKTEDIEESIKLFEESVKFAEQHGHGYEIVRNSWALAERLIFAGRFKEAVTWSYWALTEFEKRSLKDNARRLDILNVWAYASILCGELAGLETLLSENINQLESVYPALARLYRSTLGDFLIASYRPKEALKQYQINFENASRQDLGVATHNMTRAFLELGMNKEALEISKRAVDLLGDETLFSKASAILAYGMALTTYDSKDALIYINEAIQNFTSLYTAQRLFQAQLYAALAHLKLGERQKAKQVLESVSKPLAELGTSGLKLLTGPDEVFYEVLSLLRGQDTTLELRLFGKGEVWLSGDKLDVPPLWLEILTVLALKGRPVSLEELLSCLYGDEGKKDNLKTSLSKMRRVLPISQHPYYITSSYRADVVDLDKALNQGDIAKAVKLYRNSLLPFSSAPFLRETDDIFDEAVRQAALRSNEAEVLLELSERYEEDPELLEHLSAVMPLGDPRIPLVEAKLKHIQKDLFAN